jgi:para-nitrobenzyl esterase
VRCAGIFGSGRRLAAGVLAAFGAIAICATAAPAAVIQTDNGPVQGVERAVNKYLGIPYAAPPVGDLRWRPPQPHAPWTTPIDATRFANHCPQPASPFGQATNTEDCLYLNVFTPGLKPTKPRPVMFWIHGGALAVGESDDYDPTRLVKKGVVVVTFNYRLGSLGFLAHPALTAEGAGSSGDYGLMDQQAALGWVKRNIAKFGGNPKDVTIFGQSAGGLSVHSQLVSPLAKGLFHRAIAQSGAYALDFPSLRNAENRGETFATNFGCSDQTAACLRALSVPSILSVQPTQTGSVLPNIDGKVLTQSIRPALESGQFNRVPVIEGATHDEFTLFAATEIEFVFGQLPPSFYSIAVNTLLRTVGSQADPQAVQALYPVANYGDNVGRAAAAFGTDALFACPMRRAVQSLAKWTFTYAYEFADPNAPQLFIPPASFPYLAYHGSEIQYLFDIPNQTGAPGLDAGQKKLADAMVRYWTLFGVAGGPNQFGLPFWPRYTAANDTVMSLRPPTPATTSGFAADHHCDFWDANQ